MMKWFVYICYAPNNIQNGRQTFIIL